MEMDEYLKVFILRTLGINQDEVAGLLHCAKQTVVNAERWFNSCQPGEVSALLDDQRIKRVVNRDFLDIGLKSNQLLRAGQVTGDDILLHYGRVRPQKVSEEAGGTVSLAKVEPVSRVDPIYTKLLGDHWDKLREHAIVFRTQLLPPGIEALFGAEMCQKAYHAIESGSPLLSDSSWTKVIEAPIKLKLLSGTAPERTIEVRLSVEEEFLFPHLLSHLQAESDEFNQFEAWKNQLGRVIQLCLEGTENVTRSCSSAAGMHYIGAGRQKWLSFYFPAYVCQFVLNNLHSEAKPGTYTELQPDGLWKLMPEGSPAITLALDTGDHIQCCQEALDKEIKDNAELQLWHDIEKELKGLGGKTDRLQNMLTAAIEKGAFKGTCSICEGYFTPSSST
ncbi:hypothetical protein ACFLTS_01945 [Chloroflexota bacterium]